MRWRYISPTLINGEVRRGCGVECRAGRDGKLREANIRHLEINFWLNRLIVLMDSRVIGSLQVFREMKKSARATMAAVHDACCVDEDEQGSRRTADLYTRDRLSPTLPTYPARHASPGKLASDHSIYDLDSFSATLLPRDIDLHSMNVLR